MLARKADRKTNRELTLLYHRLAKAADRLGDSEKGLKYYKQSYDLDSTYLPTLIDRAALLYRLEHWDDAFRIYQTILVHHRDTQKDDQIVDIFFRLGRIKLKLGERTKAVNMFEKALEIQPGHRATLQALIELYTDAGDFEAVIKQKRSLITSARDAGRGEVHADPREIAGIYKEKLNNPQKAIAAQLEALNLKPGDRELLHDLLELFSETKQWKKAMEILMKLAELDSGAGKARFLIAAGNIANYELHSTDEAVELYNQGLDEDPDDLKAFERIDKIMTAKKDWKNQERNYRKMIKRLGTEPTPEKKPTVVALWHALGEIYRSRLKDYKAAIAAFEVCVSDGSGSDRASPDPRRAVSAVGPGDVRAGDQGVPPADQDHDRLRSDGGAPQDAAAAADGAAPVRQGLVRGGRVRRSCARATPRSSSSTSSTSPRRSRAPARA